MPVYTAPLEDIRFVLNEVIDAPALAALPGYEEMNEEGVNTVLEAVARLCEQVLLPLNVRGDAEGCVLADGKVKTPQGFKEAYKLFCDGGWTGVACKAEYGGQGLPLLVKSVIDEMVAATNMSFGIYPALSHAAYNAIEQHASDEIKRIYLPRLVKGSWTGAMCLTEPQCGTDLGLIRAKAEPQPDGTYKITGGKIFISAGEHDLAENIVYLVLARLPDALPGVRGISLFLVPKILPDDGSRNGVSCGKVEHKMGIHASATCAINFDDATGWLLAKPGKGASAMFTMVNEARLLVAMQGLGVAEASYQNAAVYARQRLQSRAMTGAKYPDQYADPIIVQPDIRRHLLTTRAMTEGCRALLYWVGRAFDCAARDPDSRKRADAADFVAMMIPVVKAFATDRAFDAANASLQVFGGHGYIRDTGIEQFVRDVRVTQIYEGANGIQAIDLVMRKMAEDHGRMMRQFFHPVSDFIAAEKDNGMLAEFMPGFASAFAGLQEAALFVATRGVRNPEEAGSAAADFLQMFGLVAVGFMWMRMVKAASLKVLVAGDRAPFYEAKIKTARFFFARILPQTKALLAVILSGSKSVMDFPEASF